MAVKGYPSGSNYFLLYHDPRWNCDFFPYIKTQSTEEKNSASIKAFLKSQLNIKPENIDLKKVGQRLQLKYSYPHKQNRLYDHTLYLAQINDLPKNMKAEHFQMPDGKQYRWATIHTMESDSEIQKRNGEVVEFVKESIF